MVPSRETEGAVSSRAFLTGLLQEGEKWEPRKYLTWSLSLVTGPEQRGLWVVRLAPLGFYTGGTCDLVLFTRFSVNGVES